MTAPSREEVEALIDRLGKDVFYGEERAHKMRKHNPLHMDAIDTLRALLAQRERDEEVKVKPLEWKGGGRRWHAGDYVIEDVSHGQREVRRLLRASFGTTYVADFTGGRPLEDAKAAAQADYERRILSALAARDAGGE